jgi:tRNA (cytidine/uridine-2'-O-)-methyltransferase
MGGCATQLLLSAQLSQRCYPAVTPLRAKPLVRPFHVILVEPEIPPNTGNIARLCAATGCPLHLAGKLGFRIDEHAVRRAGLDYWPLVEVHQHEDLEAAERTISRLDPERSATSWLFTGKSRNNFLDVPFRFGDRLVFGKESVGLPENLLEDRRKQTVAIPTLGEVRSLNLSNSVALAVYEALRRNGALATS